MKRGLLLLFLSLIGWGALLAQTKGALDRKMEQMGYLNIRELDPTIAVDLMYARADNFTGKVLYTDLKEAYLYPTAARALVKAQQALQKRHPGYRLKVCDAARPMSVQAKMYKVVKGTWQAPYVSNPANGGGLHNYGLAVDLTLIDEQGKELPMGTKVDYLGKEAHIDTEAEMVKRGTLTAAQQRNRALLRSVMREAGFKALRTEWWHFNFKSRAEAKAHYKVLDF